MRESREARAGALLEALRGGKGGAGAEARIAVLSAAGLYLVGAALTATAALLPHVTSTAGVAAVAATALVTAAALFAAVRRGHASLGLACAADLWGALLVALLCAATGGGRSPYSLIYFFAIGHAAAFQPRARLMLVTGTSVLGFVAPLAYSHVSAVYGVLASVGMVLALLTNGVVHLALERVREQRRLLESLIAATSGLDSSLDPGDTLSRIAGTAVPELAELCIVDVLDGEGRLGEVVAAAADPEVGARVEQMREHAQLRLAADGPVARALALKGPVVAGDELSSQGGGWERDDAGSEFMRAAGCRFAATFPMVARGRTHGAISFLSSRRHYSADELAVLEDLTARAAMAYDNARLYAERARVARTLRRSLMPAELPPAPGLELASFFRPMGAGDEVGGDFFDAFPDEHGCWLIVGDVCGKGAEAAALTGFVRHTALAYTRESSSPAEVLARVNRAMLAQDFSGRFATCLLARASPPSESLELELRLATAGHPPALLARAGGGVEEVGCCGTLLGIFGDPQIEDVVTLMGAGDVLALYTDGLSDAHAPRRTVTVTEMVGALELRRPRSSRDAIAALLGLLDLDGGVRDDIAILAAQMIASPRAERLHHAGSARLRRSHPRTTRTT